ncbi:MAG: RnfABCDGE type electron transport complex subunit D [Clostridia bacterium]|nr:RnfABCDGE type electron transport complex subunit D [Clostridia bacterium]
MMEKLHVDLAPFIRHPDSTKSLMLQTSCMLAILLAWCVWARGARIAVLAAILGALCFVFEVIATKYVGRPGTARDLSFAVTALILCGCLGNAAPFWICLPASFLAVAVFKHLFGGLGKNLFNPAAASLVILYALFPSFAGATSSDPAVFDPSPAADAAGLTAAVNSGTVPQADVFDYVFGFESEIGFFAPVALTLACGLFLFIRHTADFRTALSFVGVSFASAFVGSGMNAAYALWYILTGGTVFVACFVLTDPVTSPATDTGRAVSGALAAMLCFVLRRVTGFAGAPFAAVCAVNLFAPLIEYLTAPVPFGKGRKGVDGAVKRHREYVADFRSLFAKNSKNVENIKKSSSDSALRAQVMCGGTKSFCATRHIYDGSPDCASAAVVGGGRSCPFSCEGFGDCAAACPNRAIEIIDGLAAIDFRRCDGCGKCLAACPKQLITLIPRNAQYWVGCVSSEDSSSTRLHCTAGCDGCGICREACPENAISISENAAAIDPALCSGCGICAEKCPRKCIWELK